VDSVALAGVSFIPTGTTSFTLTVIDPCLSAVITASTVLAATLNVYDLVSTYSSFADFTYTSTIGSTGCGLINYIATETPPSGF
jgi:hypothetical protein